LDGKTSQRRGKSGDLAVFKNLINLRGKVREGILNFSLSKVGDFFIDKE